MTVSLTATTHRQRTVGMHCACAGPLPSAGLAASVGAGLPAGMAALAVAEVRSSFGAAGFERQRYILRSRCHRCTQQAVHSERYTVGGTQ